MPWKVPPALKEVPAPTWGQLSTSASRRSQFAYHASWNHSSRRLECTAATARMGQRVHALSTGSPTFQVDPPLFASDQPKMPSLPRTASVDLLFTLQARTWASFHWRAHQWVLYWYCHVLRPVLSAHRLWLDAVFPTQPSSPACCLAYASSQSLTRAHALKQRRHLDEYIWNS